MTDNELLKQILTTMQTMQKDVSDLKAAVQRNYDVILEFYGYQREVNTDVADRLEVIEGKLEMHDNQIARNTFEIRRIK